MPESQNPAATEPSADPAEEIQTKKAAAAELNGNDVKNGDHEPSAEDKEDTNDAVEGEDDEEVEDEDPEDGNESPEAAEAESNGKQSRKRVSDTNGHDEEDTEANGDDQPEVKKTRKEVVEEEDDSSNLVEPSADE